MNYTAHFTDTDTIQGLNFTLRRFDYSGAVRMNPSERYPVLFVLWGKLLLFSNGSEYQTLAGEMVIADRHRCRDIFCTQGTILLEYSLPKELTKYFESAFFEYCTQQIPITGRLETWVEELLMCKPRKTDSESEALVHLLLKYQSRRLKTLCGPMKHYAEKLKWELWKNSNPTIIKERRTR